MIAFLMVASTAHAALTWKEVLQAGAKGVIETGQAARVEGCPAAGDPEVYLACVECNTSYSIETPRFAEEAKLSGTFELFYNDASGDCNLTVAVDADRETAKVGSWICD